MTKPTVFAKGDRIIVSRPGTADRQSVSFLGAVRAEGYVLEHEAATVRRRPARKP